MYTTFSNFILICFSKCIYQDNIPVELVTLIHLSEKPFVQNLLPKTSNPQSPAKKKKAVLEKFKVCI